MIDTGELPGNDYADLLHDRVADQWNTHQDLARNIGYALRRSPFHLKRRQGIDLCRLIDGGDG